MNDYKNIISNIMRQLSFFDFTEDQLFKIKMCIENNLITKNEEDNKKDINIIDQFIMAKKLEGKSEETLKNYKLHLQNLKKYMEIDIETLSTEKIRMYLYKYQEKRGITNRSLEQMRRTFNSFYTWCVEEKIILYNPMSRIKTIKYTIEPRTSIEALDLGKIREACDNLRDKAIVEFLFSTGARVSEVSKVMINDVDLVNKNARILGKGSKYRTVYLNARTVLALQRYLESRKDDNPSLFVGLRRPYKTLQKPGIEAMIKRVTARTDITDNIVPHKFRHTTATVALQNGMSVPEVQKIMGHSNINTTMIYAEIDDEELSIKAKKLIK